MCFLQLVSKVYGQEIVDKNVINTFLDSEVPDVKLNILKTNNQFIYDKNNSIKIDINTIHSVKGETHKATLLLETYFNKKYHLNEIKEFIKGDFSSEKAGNPLTNYMLRLAFVAISRPTHLVGVAFHEDFLSIDERTELKSKGWNITVC